MIESDGKTENAQHVLALDPFTLAVLKEHVEKLDQERRELGPDYQDHGVQFCWEDGRPPHPDTITRRFKKLATAAGLPEIDLHDVRHSYATLGRDVKIDWKALSQRIGHADVAGWVRSSRESRRTAVPAVAVTGEGKDRRGDYQGTLADASSCKHPGLGCVSGVAGTGR